MTVRHTPLTARLSPRSNGSSALVRMRSRAPASSFSSASMMPLVWMSPVNIQLLGCLVFVLSNQATQKPSNSVRIRGDHQITTHAFKVIKAKPICICQPLRRLAGEDRGRVSTADHGRRDEEDHLLPQPPADELRMDDRSSF